MQKTITVETLIHSTKAMVWEYWTVPEHMMKWSFASDDWECASAVNDVKDNGRFNVRMQSKDGKEGFDLTGSYTEVSPYELLHYTMDDGRKVEVHFTEEGENVRVTETFEMENENPEEMQRAGWQAILDNFKKCVESR
jgi:uncharacterized protein YndB with AHSA1/START domain